MGRFARRASIFAVFLSMMSLILFDTPASGLTGNDWTKYVHDNAASGFTSETAITTSNAATLKLRPGWPMYSGTISAQPIIYNSRVYWGSWDGYMHAAPLTGAAYNWSLNFGYDSNSSCGKQGIVSTPDVVNVSTVPTPAPYLIFGAGGNFGNGGGSAQVVALDPGTGAVHWQTPLAPAPDTVIFSSPADYTFTDGSGQTVQSVYVGLASWCDEPLVQGKVVQLDAGTGEVLNTFNVVPDGCIGGSVWGSPTVDAADGSLYFVTGNAGTCASTENLAYSIVKLRASDMTLLDSWQVPAIEQIADSDFGSTPTLFKGTVWTGGPLRNLIGVANKNGTYYIFDRANLHQGPMYRVTVAKPSEDPFAGGSISPSAWDGTRVYVGGGPTKIGSLSSKGSVRALNPNNLGKTIWTAALNDGPVLGAVTAAPGIVVACEGKYVVVLNSSNGLVIAKLPVNNFVGSTAMFWGAPSISHGVVYAGDSHGVMYAWSPGGK